MSWLEFHSAQSLAMSLNQLVSDGDGLAVGRYRVNLPDTYQANRSPAMGWWAPPATSRSPAQRRLMAVEFLSAAMVSNGGVVVRLDHLGDRVAWPTAWTYGDSLPEDDDSDSSRSEWESDATLEMPGTPAEVWPDTDYEPEPEPCPTPPRFTEPGTGRVWLWFGGSSWAYEGPAVAV